jgi:hypothetical protein
LIAAFQTSDKRSIEHLNSTIIDHTNQSSIHSFLLPGIDLKFSKTIEKLNTIEDIGILALDDII